jgi:hypothetical protein
VSKLQRTGAKVAAQLRRGRCDVPRVRKSFFGLIDEGRDDAAFSASHSSSERCFGVMQLTATVKDMVKD